MRPRLVRYTDDFVICVRSQRATRRVQADVTLFTVQRLKLQINSNKSRICTNNELEFLGLYFQGNKIV